MVSNKNQPFFKRGDSMNFPLKSIVIIGAIVLVAVVVMHSCKKIEIKQKSNDEQATFSVKVDKNTTQDTKEARD